MESSIGLMEHITKANGHLIKQRVKALFGMLRAMSTEGNSKMIWQMDMAITLISTGQNIRASLRTTSKRVTEKKSGSTGLNISATTKME